LRLFEFEDKCKWGKLYKSIGQSWRRNWARVVPFFDYPPEIRKVVYTTDAIESIYMTRRKAIKARRSFPTEEAVSKLFYLVLNNISKKWPHADT
jgi:putative transposase